MTQKLCCQPENGFPQQKLDMANIGRYYRTVRHLKPSQVLWRLRYWFEERRPRRHVAVRAPEHLDAGALARLRVVVQAFADHAAPDEARIEALRRNEFSFLNVSAVMPDRIDWQRDGVSRLWLYHLHYFDYARTLADDAQRVADWMADWIAHNPPGARPGWDAFVIASRLLNWCQTLSVFPEVPAQVRQSIAEQTTYLAAHLEYDVRANHLLKNAQALVVAGSMLGEATEVGGRALAAGLPLLERELSEQILADGGHYERSLMYHCQVLEDLLPVKAVLAQQPDVVKDAIARMTRFLAQALHTDGEIPQFGDAALRAGIRHRALIALASELCDLVEPEPASGCYALEPSGFCVMAPEDNAARLIVKAGPPGPTYQLGHAHCDMLSYELTVNAKRVIVDSGVKEYEPGPWRDYCRATRAHNTVSVDGQDQLECWGAFRVGRRYRPQRDYWGAHARGWLLSASHDGLRPFRHERSVLLCEDRFWVVADVVHGGACETASFIHFHPDVTLRQENGRWHARRDGVAIIIVPFGFDAVTRIRGADNPLQGWYCPEFGKALPADCLVLRKERTASPRFGYAIFLEPSDVLLPAEGLERLAATLTSSPS